MGYADETALAGPRQAGMVLYAGIIICFSWNRNKGGHTAPFVTVEKVAERHFFELLRVLPLALAPGRQNPQSTKTYGFSSVLTHMSSEPD